MNVIDTTYRVSPITEGVKRTVLSNGMTLLTKEVHSHPIVAAMIWYRVGSRNEELGQTGKSHFLEHMMFKGTNKFGKGEIDLLTQIQGGRNNAFTWLDFTAYYFTFASDRWEVALEIESDRIRNTTFDPEEFNSEKQVIIEELQMGLDGPFDALENEVWATAFRQHPYHSPTVGWLQDVQNVTVEEMKEYYDKWYQPHNATVVLVGDFEMDKAIKKVREVFEAIPSSAITKQLRIIEPEQQGEKRIVVKKSTPMERLMIGYHAPEATHKDSYPLHIVSMLLSHGRTSRLYKRLQEQDQSVTFVQVHYNEHIDPTLFYIQAEVKPEHSLESIELAIYEEIERLIKEPISDSELNKAKRQVEAMQVLSNEEMLNQAVLLGQYETIVQYSGLSDNERGYLYLNTYMNKINEVTQQDVRSVVDKYLHANNRTVGYLIDPKKNS